MRNAPSHAWNCSTKSGVITTTQRLVLLAITYQSFARNWNYSLLIQCVRDCSLCWLQVHAAFERTKRFHFCHFCFLSEADGKGNSKESTFGDPRVAGLSGALLSPLSRDGR